MSASFRASQETIEVGGLQRTFLAADAIGRFFGLETEAGPPASPGGRPSSTLQDSPLPH